MFTTATFFFSVVNVFLKQIFQLPFTGKSQNSWAFCKSIQEKNGRPVKSNLSEIKQQA